jgi:hypothetical protein
VALTLLQLVADTCNEIGITEPTAVVGSSDPQYKQLLALANRVGKDLVRDYEWRRLDTIYVFQTTASLTKTGDFTSGATTITNMNNTTSLAAGMVVSGTSIPDFTEIVSVDSASQVTINMPTEAAGTTVSLTFSTQDYSLPTDFDRQVNDTSWDRSDHWPQLGPKSSQEWQWLTGGSIAVSPQYRWRIYQNKVRFFGAPDSVLNFAYEYISNYWVLASGGTSPTKAKFTVDTDTCVFPDDVMVLGLKFQWYKTKGLDWQVPLAEFSRAVSYAKAQDTGAPKLSLAPSFSRQYVTLDSVPDGNWTL